MKIERIIMAGHIVLAEKIEIEEVVLVGEPLGYDELCSCCHNEDQQVFDVGAPVDEERDLLAEADYWDEVARSLGD